MVKRLKPKHKRHDHPAHPAEQGVDSCVDPCITKEAEAPATAAPKNPVGRPRKAPGQVLKPVTMRLNDEQHAKYLLIGPQPLRDFLDRLPWPPGPGYVPCR